MSPKNRGEWSLTPRDDVFATYPWLREYERGIVMSRDLDGLMSALYFAHCAVTAGTTTRVVGVYELANRGDIYVRDGCSLDDAFGAIWIDLDVSMPQIRSVGQHYLIPPGSRVTRNALPLALQNSCNPNLLLTQRDGTVVEEIGDKYPFGTIHWLMWLWDDRTPTSQEGRMLMTMADSTGKNYRSFNPNATDWIQRMGGCAYFREADVLQSNWAKIREQREAQLEGAEWGFTRGNKSRAQRVPVLWEQESAAILKAVAGRICRHMGWNVPSDDFFGSFSSPPAISYSREDSRLSRFQVERSLLDRLRCSDAPIFSYAIHLADNINVVFQDQAGSTGLAI